MKPDEFKRVAKEFVYLYVSDYVCGDAEVELDGVAVGDRQTGRIVFESWGREKWVVPICESSNGDPEELELDIPDCPGHRLCPQEFWVYCWFEACKRWDQARDAVATAGQAYNHQRDQVARLFGLQIPELPPEKKGEAHEG